MELNDNILLTIKKMIGIDPEPGGDESFDVDILVYINSAIGVLHQLGVFGQTESVPNITVESTWSATFDVKYRQLVKTYVYMKVRLAFDPPASATVLASIEKQIAELEWRMVAISDAAEASVIENNELGRFARIDTSHKYYMVHD